MKTDRFLDLRKQAIALYQAQPKKKSEPELSLDTIFIALSSPSIKRTTQKYHRVHKQAAADWFIKTLEKLKGKNVSLTATQFLNRTGRLGATRSDLLATGRWLREAGYLPRKSGGRLLYDL